MSDTLQIRGIALECRLGIEEWEQQRPQPIWIDVELAIDAARAAQRDDVRDAVDYAALVQAVKDVVKGSSFRLMETLAEAVSARVLRDFAVPHVRVRVRKQALPGIEFAAVEVER